MLEDEYFEIIRHLDSLQFKIPQSGIKFKYGNFLVESSIDAHGKEVYAVKKDNFSFLNNFAHLYPRPNGGFTIRDMEMPFQCFMEFLSEIEKYDQSISGRRILVSEGFIINLLHAANEKCPICMDEYNEKQNIYLFNCGYHSSHRHCATIYGLKKKCPVCRKE